VDVADPQLQLNMPEKTVENLLQEVVYIPMSRH
jgi:hypothetical protein